MKKNNIKKWAKEMRKKYPDRFPPMYWLWVDLGIINNKTKYEKL